MKTLRDAIFCMYTLIVSTNICDFKILTFEVIGGQKHQSRVTPQCQDLET